jgi:hypothetical protein
MRAGLDAHAASSAFLSVHVIDTQRLVELDGFSGARLHARMLIALDTIIEPDLTWLRVQVQDVHP